MRQAGPGRESQNAFPDRWRKSQSKGICTPNPKPNFVQSPFSRRVEGEERIP